VEANRDRLAEIIGCVDGRQAARMERFGDDSNPALVAETDEYRVFQVRWPVLDGIDGEGLLVQPKTTPRAHVVAVPDADLTPEQILGLADGLEPEKQYARVLAQHGIELVIPVLISRGLIETEDPQLIETHQTWREWIYRQAFHMGRHPIGYEVQKVLAAVDWFRLQNDSQVPIGVCGYGEGGLVAFYAGALDPRIDAVLVSGYFDSRQKVWSEPIYRNVWSLLRRFGDAEVASMILPRGLIIEHSAVPHVTGQKGEWNTPDSDRVRAEFARIPLPPDVTPPELIMAENGDSVGPGSRAALQSFTRSLSVDGPLVIAGVAPADRRERFDPSARLRRAVLQLEGHVQGLIQASEQVRDRAFLNSVMPELTDLHWSTEKSLPVHSPSKFIEGSRPFRERFYSEAMGRFEVPLLPPAPRSRKILESKDWVAYDVVLDVWPEVFAWGILVVPKEIKPGERRPVVVCQHGRNGVPRDTVDGNDSAYNNFAARLAEEGFVTFAPHNLYRGEDRYRWLDRKANSVGASLFSFIIAQHDQILRWLGTLPFVDAERIAFYGLSYGGETGVRVPPILEGYCLSIVSGDFNQWTRKVAATDQPFSFMRTIEWEMPYWNLGQTFDYAEMAYLMVPRPFMVERGHLDLVGRDQWVAHEYAKVRWLYAQLGLADRTEIEFFQGGHSINGQGTFEFLHKHLGWPKR
jgi:dienelactone hydrolase